MYKTYEPGDKAVYYASREVEIVDKNKNPKFYFNTIYQLAETIKGSPELAKKLKELI